MIIIALLIGVSLSIALLFLAIFYWNIKSGQYDDTYSPSVRILFDDKPAEEKPEEKVVEKKEDTNKS
ncbi:MAG: cbb3-type cytochrome oxidase assembly protein CcoS [Bacteroidetes bacterium]|nr:cbb3-type cytochrome oxidase assembly protein CcoS [Bacteroidota bacterium]MBS1976779.1 cbb3-type cytochrome oxidase assembly protein CcoS [Bacteroidota bacterium]